MALMFDFFFVVKRTTPWYFSPHSWKVKVVTTCSHFCPHLQWKHVNFVKKCGFYVLTWNKSLPLTIVPLLSRFKRRCRRIDTAVWTGYQLYTLHIILHHMNSILPTYDSSVFCKASLIWWCFRIYPTNTNTATFGEIKYLSIVQYTICTTTPSDFRFSYRASSPWSEKQRSLILLSHPMHKVTASISCNWKNNWILMKHI